MGGDDLEDAQDGSPREILHELVSLLTFREIVAAGEPRLDLVGTAIVVPEVLAKAGLSGKFSVGGEVVIELVSF